MESYIVIRAVLKSASSVVPSREDSASSRMRFILAWMALIPWERALSFRSWARLRCLAVSAGGIVVVFGRSPEKKKKNKKSQRGIN